MGRQKYGFDLGNPNPKFLIVIACPSLSCNYAPAARCGQIKTRLRKPVKTGSKAGHLGTSAFIHKANVDKWRKSSDFELGFWDNSGDKSSYLDGVKIRT
ncbi:hypothetical protein GCM10027594_11970 [Hymenobacter agri]